MMGRQRFAWEVAQWIVIAMLAFSMFAWIEVQFFLPSLERDLDAHMHTDTVYIIDGDTIN